MAYTEQDIINEINDLMYELGIDYFPTHNQMHLHKGLSERVQRIGGTKYLCEKYEYKIKPIQMMRTYSDENILNELNDLITTKNMEHFPTRQEMIDFCNGNNHLCNLVYKRGGCKYWADKVGLPLKESDTKTGWLGEDILQEKLLSLNYKVEKQTTGNGFDFLVEDYVKTECKYSHLYKGGSGNFYAFNLDSSAKNSDIIVFICEDDNGNRKFLVIPTFKILNITTLSVGENKSKYYQYMDKFDYIDKYKQFFQNLS